VTQNGSRTGKEDSRHPAATLIQVLAADGVDTAVNRVKPASTDSVGYGVPGIASLDQLPARDHAVLSANKLPDSSVHLLNALAAHRRLDRPLGGIRPFPSRCSIPRERCGQALRARLGPP
jgi:hypothetical protein